MRRADWLHEGPWKWATSLGGPAFTIHFECGDLAVQKGGLKRPGAGT